MGKVFQLRPSNPTINDLLDRLDAIEKRLRLLERLEGKGDTKPPEKGT